MKIKAETLLYPLHGKSWEQLCTQGILYYQFITPKKNSIFYIKFRICKRIPEGENKLGGQIGSIR